MDNTVFEGGPAPHGERGGEGRGEGREVDKGI